MWINLVENCYARNWHTSIRSSSSLLVQVVIHISSNLIFHTGLKTYQSAIHLKVGLMKSLPHLYDERTN